MIDNPALQSILTTATDISIVCELYDADTVPTDDGFDPADALDCFAAVDGITFRTRTYKKLVKQFGNISRSITGEINDASVTFSNLDRQISQFEFAYGFEGLLLVIRLISRGSSVALSDSQILFVGRCEKPKSGNRDALSVSAKFILDSLDVKVPRRKFAPIDYKGRPPTDPEFEGFINMPRYGITVYNVRVKRGGILGLFGFHKTVKQTLQYSSYSDLDVNKPVPELFGTAQMVATQVGYEDTGTLIQFLAAFCEGEVTDITNQRSVDDRMPLSGTNYTEAYGKVGTANTTLVSGWIDDSYYSKTVFIRGQVSNSAVDVVEPVPDIVAVIYLRKLTTPDGSGVWNVFIGTDNAAAVVRYLLTNEDYYNLDPAWIDDNSFWEVFKYNGDLIFDTSTTDFLFLE